MTVSSSIFCLSTLALLSAPVVVVLASKGRSPKSNLIKLDSCPGESARNYDFKCAHNAHRVCLRVFERVDDNPKLLVDSEALSQRQRQCAPRLFNFTKADLLKSNSKLKFPDGSDFAVTGKDYWELTIGAAASFSSSPSSSSPDSSSSTVTNLVQRYRGIAKQECSGIDSDSTNSFESKLNPGEFLCADIWQLRRLIGILGCEGIDTGGGGILCAASDVQHTIERWKDADGSGARESESVRCLRKLCSVSLTEGGSDSPIMSSDSDSHSSVISSSTVTTPEIQIKLERSEL